MKNRIIDHGDDVVSQENATPSPQKNIITIVRDPNSPLGKRFELTDDGKINKTANVKLSFGVAIQHHISTAAQFKSLLEDVGNDSHAAIINSYFADIPIGEEFAIVSIGKMSKRLGVSIDERDKLKGIHTIEFDGEPMKMVCRMKENMRPSSWVLIDRDVDEQTPDAFAKLGQDEFLEKLASLLPGIKTTSMVFTPSSSSRVTKDGQPVSGGNGHMYVKVSNPEDLDRTCKTIIPRAIELGLAWPKPKFSKTNPEAIVAQSWATLIDQSVWNPGRLIFCGKPTVSGGLKVLPPSIDIREGVEDVIDTAHVVVADTNNVRKISRAAGSELDCSVSNGVITIKANDLTLDTELNTLAFGFVTVRDLLAKSDIGKVRCQAPFRETASWAAFLRVNKDGIPFVYDSGTNITHWLNSAEHDDVKVMQASQIIDKLLIDVTDDAAVVLEPYAIEALALIKKLHPADFQRKRAQLKKANSKVPLMELEDAVKDHLANDDGPSTHHGYARELLDSLAFEEWTPVVHNGALHAVVPSTNLWVPVTMETLQRNVAEAFDGQDNCYRGGDYKAIASHALSLSDKSGFFENPQYGIATPDGFYRVQDGEVTVEPLSPDHRQRFAIDVVPTDQPTPMFDTFLHETFASSNEGEEEQQCRLLQEVFGAVMLGLMPRFQKAVKFYDPYGRAGKGTVERILRRLVPKAYITAVSPFSWDSDYHVATLAQSRLNVVGELPDDKPIPAAAFKSVLGGDLITGRHPTHRPITFTNEAAHIFMSNHMINTRDHSEAFFARWILLEFPNSLLRSGKKIDPGLADRIIKEEMPGIIKWALNGATRLLMQGKFSESIVHDRLMGEWRRNRNSLEMFIYESCKLSPDAKTRRSEFYAAYVAWCGEVGKKPFAKSRVKELLEHNMSWGLRISRPNGNETINGIEVVTEDFTPV